MAWRCGVGAVAAALLLGAPRAGAATITVTTTADAAGACSLREAVTAAATDVAVGGCAAGSGDDTISLGAGTYTLSIPGTAEDANATGDLDIVTGNLTVSGAGTGATTIDANGIDRAFDTLANTSLTLTNLTVTNGVANAGGATGTAPDGSAGNGGHPAGGNSDAENGKAGAAGGAIRATGKLVLDGVGLTHNRSGAGGTGGAAGIGGAGAEGGGGGISSAGTGGPGGGGGAIGGDGADITIAHSTFTDNATGAGGKGGACGTGGAGGAGTGNGSGADGGDCFGGSGGSGGDGGAIYAINGSLTISGSDFERNATGPGGPGGGGGSGGTGGAGAGTGNGGRGGAGRAGTGGGGGSGGAIAVTGNAPVSIGTSTIGSGRAGDGGAASTALVAGGVGGAGGGGTGGGAGGGLAVGGQGGNGGGAAAIYDASFLTSTLRDVTISGNAAGAGTDGAAPGAGGFGGGDGGGGGGGGLSGGSLGGKAGDGGGIGAAFFRAAFALTNVTITGNRSGDGGNGGPGGSGPGASQGGEGGAPGDGGGVVTLGSGAMSHVTLVKNGLGGLGKGGAAGSGLPVSVPGADATDVAVGGDVYALLGGQFVTVSASILGTCQEPLGNGGGDIALTDSCPGTVGDPGLPGLADNGGPVATMALPAGSLALDAIPVPCGTTPDARGVARPQGGGCDAGAYERAPAGADTGAASSITTSSAFVVGTVHPNARATTWHVEFGPTPAYGKATPDVAVAAGVDPVGVIAGISGLAAKSVVHYRLVASNADGSSAGADQTFTTASTPAKAFTGVGLKKRALKLHAGKVRVVVSCPKAASGTCRGTLTLTAKKHRLARKAFAIAAGGKTTVVLKLGKRARARVPRHRKLKVNLSATARDGAGRKVATKVATKLGR